MSYPSLSAETSSANHRQATQAAMTEINLMRKALRRADQDWSKAGTVSCETMEFIRSVRSLQS